MAPHPLEDIVKNVDTRLTRIEQVLPTLATKAELRTAIAEAIAPLATKVEMREEGEHTRRHFDVVAERLESQIRLLAEGQMALRERMDDRFEHVAAQLAGLDRRVMRLTVA